MDPTQNHLMACLAPRDRIRLLGVCEPYPLAVATVLCERGQAAQHVYFPMQGVISLLMHIQGHPGLEVGMVGREGMLGVQTNQGVVISPVQALVLGPGMAWRARTQDFLHELGHCASLQRGLDRYVHVTMVQMASAVACQRFHLIGPRLARWLLMTQDRASADSFRVTHERLAGVLGVRRVGITTAAVALQRQGLIEYHRGALTVIDRLGLEAVACSCYHVDLHVHAEWMPVP